MSDETTPWVRTTAATTTPTLDKPSPASNGPRQSVSGSSYEPSRDADAGDTGGPPARRFWSPRRVPATLLALTLLLATGPLLYDVVRVRTGGQATSWRRELAQQLASRPIDDAWVIVGASAALLAGAWLVLLALAPGLRGLLPMHGASPELRAGLERKAAALVLRDRAMEVSGVESVRVSMSRKRVTARARSHFRPLDEVRADLDGALHDGIDQLGLARPPGLRVRVRRPAKG